MKIVKLQGCGNDFIFTEDQSFLKLSDKRDFVKRVCQRKYSIGADGFVYLEKQKDSFKWDFYNADGSDAEMCGNAARCAARYLKNKYEIEEANLITLAGEVLVSQIGTLSRVEMKVLIPLSLLSEGIYFTNTGVPHIVAVNPKDELDIVAKFRDYNNGKDDTGCNVTILTSEGARNLAKTFERGVEAFTLACGTGAVAAALVVKELQGRDKISLHMPGGNLEVMFAQDKVYLLGPAEEVFEGEIDV